MVAPEAPVLTSLAVVPAARVVTAVPVRFRSVMAVAVVAADPVVPVASVPVVVPVVLVVQEAPTAMPWPVAQAAVARVVSVPVVAPTATATTVVVDPVWEARFLCATAVP